MACPPSWVIAVSNETRVRSEGFSKSMASVLPRSSESWSLRPRPFRFWASPSRLTSSSASRSVTERTFRPRKRAAAGRVTMMHNYT